MGDVVLGYLLGFGGEFDGGLGEADLGLAAPEGLGVGPLSLVGLGFTWGHCLGGH